MEFRYVYNKQKYHQKVASDDAVYVTYLRNLDMAPLFASYVWMQLPVFDLSELGLGLLYNILPIEFQPLTIDFQYQMPTPNETLQGIWANFVPVRFEQIYTWMTDLREYVLENFVEEFQLQFMPTAPEKAVYGVTPYGAGIYDPIVERDFIRATFHKLRLMRTPDTSWLSTMDSVVDYLKMLDVTDEHIFNRLMLLFSAQTNAFVLGLSVLGVSRLSTREGDWAVIPFMDAKGNVYDVKFRTLDHLQIGFILGVTPLGFGVLLSKDSVYKLPEGKKNPPIARVVSEKTRGTISRLSLSTWAWSNYNKPEEMVDYHKSDKADQYDLLQMQRRMIESWVEARIPSEEATAVKLRQYQNAVLQAVCWRAKRHCYDEETEILTENGWKKYFELEIGEKVATLNKDGVIEYQPIKNVYIYPYKGKMYHLRNNVIDLMVTPEHRLYVSLKYWKKNSKFELIEAKDVFGKGKRFKKDGKWITKNNPQYFILPEVDNPTHKSPAKKIPMEEWLKFFGLWLAEGCTLLNSRGKNEYIVEVSNSNSKLLDEIADLCRKWGFNPIKSGDCGLQIYSKQLYSYLKQFGKAENKYIPKEIKNLPPKYLKVLFEYMMKGDGYIGVGGDSYSTTSKRLADDVQEIALKIGRVAHVRFDKFTRTGKPLYEVSILKPIYNKPQLWHKKDREKYEKWVDYDGIVWCVETDNGVVYVRRNGKPVWSGNSWGFQGWESMTEDQFREWWINYWSGQGLNTQVLTKLYDDMSVWLQRIRDEKYKLGEKIKRTRRRLALTV